MKRFISIALMLLSLNALANPIKVDVLSADFGVLDNMNNRSLCVTVIQLPQSHKLFAVVESIEDCFYARLARRSGPSIEIDLKYLSPIEHVELRDHLQKLDSNLEFYFSDGE